MSYLKVKEEIVLIGGYTARTNSYLQALHENNIKLKEIILFGDGEKSETKGMIDNIINDDWVNSPVFIPDLSRPIDDLINKITGSIHHIETNSINDQKIIDKIQEIEPKIIIYSGYGGQIVGEKLLSLEIPILHLHSGWLPDFRGSTTTYYHILESDYCAVSAIFLEKNIDEGPILAREKYPKPPNNIDIDYIYDNAIRSDLLVKVLKKYSINGSFRELIKQKKDKGETYYIIHPVLKHLAILSTRD